MFVIFRNVLYLLCKKTKEELGVDLFASSVLVNTPMCISYNLFLCISYNYIYNFILLPFYMAINISIQLARIQDKIPVGVRLKLKDQSSIRG